MKTSFTDFVRLVAQLKDVNELEDFLVGITTPMERDEFGRRLEIVQSLIMGDPQHKIAKDLGVGVATVTRGSKELKAGRFGYLKDMHL